MQEAANVRVQLESIFRHGRDYYSGHVSRTGGSIFMSSVRTNVHATLYERVRRFLAFAMNLLEIRIID